MTTKIHLHFYGATQGVPVLEVKFNDAHQHKVAFRPTTKRLRGEAAWEAHFDAPARQSWQFRINLGHDTYAFPHGGGSFDWYETALRTLWVQNGQLYDYQPLPFHTLSRIVKVPHFLGLLPRRPLYIYLPRGYDQHTFKLYPVIYMHDGQNCFEQWTHDSFSGSWRADQTADALIAAGKMRECLIVGVGNSHNERIAEYLPPTATYDPKQAEDGTPFTPIQGRADHTARYYRDDVISFVERYYRAIPDRRQRATCGSSMGGLFSLYLAWDRPDLAQHHAVMSPSLWITGDPEHEYANPPFIHRLRHDTPRDVRIWLDSGTKYSPHHGDDGMRETIAARDALLENGYTLNQNLGYYLHHDAIHNEASWAERLPQVFQFLFPFTG